MSAPPADIWTGVRLVAFDVDGTLYDQAPLRRLMLRDLVVHTAATRSLRVARLLTAYRRRREALAEAEVPGFEAVLRGELAASHGIAAAEVDALLDTWMHRKPLRHLPGCAVPAVREAFAAVRGSGRVVGVLSDYPAEDKLAALGLQADLVVHATMPEVDRLKPHPAGLRHLMRLAGVGPAETLLVGDRPERDGIAARRAGARCLIRSSRDGDFTHFGQAPFDRIPPLAQRAVAA